MFRRRNPAPLLDRAREFVSPRKGWERGYRYLGKRMQRLPDSPHRIALGFACGVQASFTPFFGFHFVVAAGLGLITRGNVLASAVGTFMGNPITFPFIAAASMWMGQRMTGIEFEAPEDGYGISWLWDNLDAIFIPYLVGGTLPGFAVSAVSYWVLRPLVATYQDRRRVKLMARAKERLRKSAHGHAAVTRGHHRKPSARSVAKDAPG